MRVETHGSIAELDAGEWDALVPPGAIFFTHRFLTALEASGVADGPPGYVTVWRGERLVAHTCAFPMSTDLVLFSEGPLKALVEGVRKLWPGFLHLRILECACPVGLVPPLHLAEGVAIDEVAAPLAEGLGQLARAGGNWLTVMRDFRDHHQATFDALRPRGFHPLWNMPTCDFPVRWRTLPDYEDAMRARYRSKWRRRLRKAEAAGLRTEVWNHFADQAEHLTRQWSNVNAAAKEYSREQVPPAIYAALSEASGGGGFVVAVFDGDDQVAHAAGLRDGPVLRWMFFGREEQDVKQDAAYFAALREVLRLAMEEGFETIDMGITTYTLKTEVGAEMIPLTMLLACPVPGLARLLTALHRWANPVPEVRQVAVFKEGAGG